MKKFISLFVIAGAILFSQSARFDRIGLSQGLSQSTVRCGIQDAQGFMWFGTQDGLNKFDGYSFRVFRHDPWDSNSIADNSIWSIVEDMRGRLWIGTDAGGLDIYNPITEKFSHVSSSGKGGISMTYTDIRTIFRDHEGGMWVGTTRGMNYFDPRGELATTYLAGQGLRNESISAIAEDTLGQMWIGTANGLFVLDRRANFWKSYFHQLNSSKGLNNSAITAICKDQDGAMWVGTQNGLHRSNKDDSFTQFTHDKKKESLGDSHIYSIYQDRSKTMWVGTQLSGLHRWTGTGFIRYENDAYVTHSLSNNSVTSIVEDRSGQLWIGTDGGGISVLNRETNKFSLFRHEAGDKNSVSSDIVWSFCEDADGKVWIGTDDGGLNYFDRATREFKVFRHEDNNPKSISNNTVRVIYRDRSGELWFGTDGGGLNRYDRKSHTFRSYQNIPGDSSSLGHNSIRSLLEDSFGNFWIGTYGGGLEKMDRAKGTFSHFQNSREDSESISGNFVRALLEDAQGRFWVGVQGGLNLMNRETGTFKSYSLDPSNPRSLSNSRVWALHQDRAGRIWVGTAGGGLNYFDPIKETFQFFTERDGLPNGVINAILEDDQENLWLSSNGGLVKATVVSESPMKLHFRGYSESDGLQSNEFNSGAALRVKSGEMFFGGVKGFNIFHPNALQDNSFIPPVVITSFKKLGHEMKWSQSIFAPEISIPHNENYFSIEFAALNYSHSEKNQYRYKLENFNMEWIESGSRRMASYTNIDPGDYTFRVRASNNDGVWNEEGASILIHIVPPFWKTWWFRATIAILAIGFVFGGFRWRIHQIHKQKRELEKEVEARTTELKIALDDLKKAESQLVQHEKLASLGQMVAGIAHEINNPLAFVMGNFDIVSDYFKKLMSTTEEYEALLEMADESLVQKIQAIKTKNDLQFIESDVKDLIQSCHTGAGRIKKIVEDLRSFSRTGSEESESFQIHDGLDSSLSVLEAQLENRIEVVKNYGTIPKILCYPAHLNQVFMNVLQNAEQSIPEKGKIEITTCVDNETILIRIKDSGTGISPENLSKIFDPFFTTHTIGKGTGLGLSNAYGIINRHGGEIWCQSELGKGSEIFIRLPLKPKLL